jgi:Mn2+/Fe2+ NRAMP family transporter
MIALTLYVAFASSPPVGEAAYRTFVPEKIDMIAIVTLVGGTVGGYITFAGGHRLLEAGITGKSALREVTNGAVSGILIASLMRIMLFLAALGVVSQGLQLNPDNPPASVFQLAAGNIGYKLFGLVMWAAAITSVVGSAYTSVSFIKTLHPVIKKYEKTIIVIFIILSTAAFAAIGKPVKLLILVGALNGLILPLSLGVMLMAAHKKSIIGDYRHPKWLTIFGIIILAVMAYMSVYTIMNISL